MLDRIFELLRKEFIQLFRDPRMRAIIFGLPVVQLMIFGYVVNIDVNNVRLAVLDLDRSPRSRELIQRFEASGYFTLTHIAEDMRQLEDLMLAEEADLALYVPHGFSAQLDGHSVADVQSLVNGSVSNIAAVVAQYAAVVVDKFSSQVAEERRLRTSGALPPELRRRLPPADAGIDLRIRAWYNADLESRNFYLPGVVAFLVMLISLLLTSMAVVKEKEVGTMEQLVVTPLRPLEIILGKTLPFALAGLMVMAVVVTVAIFWFHIPVRGSYLLLFFGGLLFIGCALGIGLFISTISGTMQQAVMTTFFLLNPLFLLSGFAFPIEDMPTPIQYLTYLNPLRYFLVIVRGIFLKGVGLDLLWPQYSALAVIAVMILAASTMRFRKRME